MRKARCKTCKALFYYADDTPRDNCQDCGGDAPDKTQQLKLEDKMRKESNSVVNNDKPQSIDLMAEHKTQSKKPKKGSDTDAG